MCSTSCRNAQDVQARQVRNAKCTRPSNHELCFVARWPFLKGCQRSKERAAGSTGSIQAVCALLHHVSNILNDQVLSFVQHELAEVSEEGFTDILSKDSKVIICENPVHWHFDVDLFRLSELIFLCTDTGISAFMDNCGEQRWNYFRKRQHSHTRHSGALSRVSVFFSNRWIASDFELFFAPGVSPYTFRHSRRMGAHFELLEWNSGVRTFQLLFLSHRPSVLLSPLT